VTDVGEPALVRATALEISRGSLLAGRYQVEAVIGRGGSGIVLRAFDRVAQVPVAVKILKPDLASDPRWIERFSRELRLARQIQHPNVCRVFDIGQADGHWFITMELATAGTLRDQLGKHATDRAIAEKIADIRAVTAGLAAIHEAGIVHRDLKPDNFLRMADGRLVLSDFGLATNPADAPVVSIMVGTPHYMAPEVVMGEAAVLESDVWSAGVVIHEILLGKRPERTSPTRTLAAKASANAPLVERRLCRIAETCLADEPTDRPHDGPALRGLVDEVVANPNRAIGRGRRGSRSYWGLIVLAVLALAAASSRRLWQPATASTSKRASVAAIVTEGSAHDLSVGAKRLATIAGKVHCFSLLPGGESARIVWGSPRRAIDIDLTSGARQASQLPPETFAAGCPQIAPGGNRLLFTRQPTDSLPVIMLAKADGTEAKPVTNGSDPLWLPSEQEFVFNLDSSHAGVFSLPTKSYSLLDDSRGSARRYLSEKFVGPRGDLLAVLYTSDNPAERVLDLQALPNLGVVASWILPYSIHLASFGEQGVLLTDVDTEQTLERLDWRSGRAARIGRWPGRTVRSVAVDSRGDKVLLSRADESDAWLFEPGKRPRQVTDDGRTYSASASPSGQVLLGRLLGDGRYVIALQDRAGSSKLLTKGPADSLPSFAADGTEWLYAAYDRKAIVRCKEERCVDVVLDRQIPIWPVMSPDHQSIAYITSYGSPHLHLADRDGGNQRDLGPAAIECPPVWTSARSIWAFSGAGTNREWREIDANTRKQTGASKTATGFAADEGKCGWEGEAASSPFYQRARIVVHESWEVATRPAGLD
jgi:serine/threonine-protein kinase